MTDEKLRKASKLQNQIRNVENLLQSLGWRKEAPERAKATYARPNFITTPWKLRFLNKEDPWKETRKPVAMIFDNLDIRGTEIYVDEDFLDYVIEYFVKKRDVLTKEYEEL